MLTVAGNTGIDQAAPSACQRYSSNSSVRLARVWAGA